MASSDEFNPYRPPGAGLEDAAPAAAEGPAGRGDRFAAWVVDWLLLALAFGLGGMLGGYGYGASGAALALYVGWWLPAGLLAVLNLALLARRGQTVGKWNRGLRIVRTDGARAGLPRLVILRFAVPHAAFVAPALLGIPLLGFILFVTDSLCIYGPNARCLHDRLADTQVMET